MKCPDIAPLVTRFFDGELDGPHMRTVALHITRCPECEQELRALEKIQGMVVAQAAADIEGIDTDSIWRAVAAEIEDAPIPWTQRLRAWWEDSEFLSPVTVWPAVAAAAAVFLAINFWQGDVASTGSGFVETIEETEISKRIAGINTAEGILSNIFRSDASNLGVTDNSAVFESIVGDVDRLMIEPETQTAVLWIGDNGEFR